MAKRKRPAQSKGVAQGHSKTADLPIKQEPPKSTAMDSCVELYQYFDKTEGEGWKASILSETVKDSACDYSNMIQRFISNQMTVSLFSHASSFKP